MDKKFAQRFLSTVFVAVMVIALLSIVMVQPAEAKKPEKTGTPHGNPPPSPLPTQSEGCNHARQNPHCPTATPGINPTQPTEITQVSTITTEVISPTASTPGNSTPTATPGINPTQPTEIKPTPTANIKPSATAVETHEVFLNSLVENRPQDCSDCCPPWWFWPALIIALGVIIVLLLLILSKINNNQK